MLRIYDLNLSKVPRSEVQQWLDEPATFSYPTTIVNPIDYSRVDGLFLPDGQPDLTSSKYVGFSGTFKTLDSAMDASLEINYPRQSKIIKFIGRLIGRAAEDQGNAAVYLGVFWDIDDGRPDITVKENY